MKDKIDLMDKAIKEKFAHHEVPVPSNLWNSIQSKLPVEENPIARKSFLKNPFAISLLIVSTILVSTYLYQASTTENNSQHTKEENTSTISNIQQYTTERISTNPSNELNETNSNKTNDRTSSISSAETKTVSTDLMNNNKNTTTTHSNLNSNLNKSASISQENTTHLNNKSPKFSLKENKQNATPSKNNTTASNPDITKQHTSHATGNNQKINNNTDPNTFNKNQLSKQSKKTQGIYNGTNKENTSTNLNSDLQNNHNSKITKNTNVYSDSTTHLNSALNNTTSLSALNKKSSITDNMFTNSNANKIDSSNTLLSKRFNDNQINANESRNTKSTFDTTELNHSTDSNTLLTNNNSTKSTKRRDASEDSTTQDTPTLNNILSASNSIDVSTNNDKALASGETRNNDSLNSLSNTNQIDNNAPLNKNSIADTPTLYTTNISEAGLKLNSTTNQSVASRSNVDSLSKNNTAAQAPRLQNDIQSHPNAITAADSLQLKIDSTIIAKEIDSTSLAHSTNSTDEIKIEEKKKSDFLSRCTIDGYVTPSLAYMHLSPNTSTPEQNNFTNERNKNAKPGSGITTGLRMNYRLTKKVEIGIGIQYSSIQQSSSFQNSQLDHINTSYQGYNRIDTLYDSIGHVKSYSSRFIITDSTKTSIYSTRIVTHTDKFQNISIPIHIAYGYSISEKFSLIARTSLLINLQTYSVTYIKESDSTIVSQHSAKNISLGGSFSIGAYYLLSRKCTAFIEPIVTYSFSNVFDKQVPFKQTQYQLGLQTGIRISF
jgi:hypothetical protein